MATHRRHKPLPALPPQRSNERLDAVFSTWALLPIKPLNALNTHLGRRQEWCRQPGYRPTR